MARTMDRSEWKDVQKERKQLWKDYQYRHKDELLEFARKLGIDDPKGNIDFILAESFSRALGVKVIKNNYPNCELLSMPLHHHYDFDLITEDGEVRGIEIKFRLNDIDEYPTDDISLSKKDYLSITSEDKPIDLVYIFYDGNVRVYDINGPSTTSTWTHNKKTAVYSESITDSCLQFNRWDNLWTTNVTIPL